MNIENLKSKIFELTGNRDIFIEEKHNELIIHACTGDSELYTIYIKIQVCDSFIVIRNYVIDHSIRGMGIGSNFYTVFEKYIKSCGYSKIKLHLVSTYAEKFWKKHGFSKDSGEWLKLLNTTFISE